MSLANLEIIKFRGIILTLFLILAIEPAFSQEDYRTVEAKNGDGIYLLLRRYGLHPSEYLDEFIALNKSALGDDNSLISGKKYKLPVKPGDETPANNPVGSTVTYPIFGDKYKDVTITSNELSGAVYYLCSGHGGPDPGAMAKFGQHTLCEDEYAYDVTLRLARNLIALGASVYMITRDPNDGIRDEQFLKPDKDEVCYPDQIIPLNQLSRLRQRKDAVNKLYIKNKNSFQRLIVIHVDSRSRSENIDVFFYYDKRSKTGHTAANILQQTFSEKYRENQPGRGYHGSVSTRNLFMVKNTYAPTVYIELGNINHYRDQQRLIVTDNRQALANWLTFGLEKDFQDNK